MVGQSNQQNPGGEGQRHENAESVGNPRQRPKRPQQQRQHRQRGLDCQHNGIVVPEASGTAPSKHIGRMPGGIVGPQRLKPQEEMFSRKPGVQEIDLTEGEQVARPNRQGRGRQDYCDAPFPGSDFPHGAAQPLVRSNQVAGIHQGPRGGQEQERRELRKHGQSGKRSQDDALAPAGALGPGKRSQGGGAGQRGCGHIGGDQPGVRENRRKRGEQKNRQYGGSGTGNSARPQIHHQGARPEERENSGPPQGQEPVIMRAVTEDSITLHVGIWSTVPSLAGQKRPQRAENPGQRSMQVLVAILADAQPFHASGQVIGFVDSVAEDRIGRDDARRPDQDQEQGRHGLPVEGVSNARHGHESRRRKPTTGAAMVAAR